MKLKMKKVIFFRWKDSEQRERERERERKKERKKEPKRRDTLESEDGTSREKKK